MTGAAAPGPVTAARVLLALVTLGHLVVLTATLSGQTALRRQLATQHPGPEVEHLAATATTTALAVHVPLLVLTGVLTLALGSGHPWALRPTTVSQAFAIAFSRLSTPHLPLLEPLVPLSIAAAAVIIALLWLPRPSRTFFAKHPRSRRRPDPSPAQR